LVEVAQSFLPAFTIPAHCSVLSSSAKAVEVSAAPASVSTPVIATFNIELCLLISESS
jgi:hypothetical protein